jgi:hypothetical protein
MISEFNYIKNENDECAHPGNYTLVGITYNTWWTALGATKDAITAFQKTQRPPDLLAEVLALLGPLASPHARISLQHLTYLYEAALVQFPGSFKLWKSYLQMRMSFVLGKLVIKKWAGGKKKFPDMKDALEEEKEDLEQWENGLDGVVGWDEWKSLVATFEIGGMKGFPNWENPSHGGVAPICFFPRIHGHMTMLL